jgi:hypothetical protein
MKQIETGREITDNVVAEKAREKICFIDDGNSNEIDESDLQEEKQDGPRISTEDGIETDSNFEYKNECDSIRFNDDGDSNKIDDSDVQYAKHDDPRIST